VGWIVLTLLLVILNAVMIPRYDALLQATCHPGPQCFAPQLTAADRMQLHQLGLSVGFVATYQVALDAVSVLVYCALGALIFWRKSADRMALFCAFALVLFGGAGFTNILQDTLAPFSSVWFVVVGVLDLLGQSSIMIFFLLFPSGRFVPRWTRWVACGIVLYWIISIFVVNNQAAWTGPIFFASLLCVVGTQIYRYRRVSTPRERQQTKWVVFGFSIGIIGFILAVVLANTLQPLHQTIVLQTLVGGTIIYACLLLIPISIAVAILRSRLYNIDVIINRALVYGTLTLLLALLYAGLIIGLQALLGAITGQNNAVAIVVSTLAIYALFQPLRRRTQNLIDRRFYRRKYDAARTLAAFNATLRVEVDLNQLSEQLLSVVEETMQPAHVSLWLRQGKQSKTDRDR
jgi:uncharacterized membrane protein SirB2